MDIIGTVLCAAETLKNALECKELIETLLVFGFESDLADFQRTVGAITDVLRDAEAKQLLPDCVQSLIEDLKDAVLEADDLVDEFLTLSRQQHQIVAEGSLFERVRHFLSFSNPICVSYWMARGIKDVKKKLDAIAYNTHFNLNIDPEPTKIRSRETCSYVHAVDIIGREQDLEKMVGILLDVPQDQDVSFLSIVGIGGLGKTALAQLVFNETRVTTTFPLKLWTCVSDQGQVYLDTEVILRKILASATGETNEGATMDQVQNDLREKFMGKRFLLVLDDVWNEDREQWSKVTSSLLGGQRGSKVLVTTRSKRTAGIVGDGFMHELKGLSKENSWCLFKRVAFRSWEQPNPPEDLVDIGKVIVDRCANVPLAIRVVGSLLYGQDKCKWQSLREFGLAQVEENKMGIVPILKLSYNQLERPLKSCFGYSALFPKGYVMKKKTLISLWMAQGYIPVDDQQRMEAIAEEYFLVLLQRCFFQDVREDAFGNIQSCKIHDLMHDVAHEVAGKEICVQDTLTGIVDKKVRHFCLSRCESPKYRFTKTHIRSYLHVGKRYGDKVVYMDQLSMNTLLVNWKYLRVLQLNPVDVKSLPSSICELLHLRYLDLSYSKKLEMLPTQMTKLCNLQTLILKNCYCLKELPKDISKLVNLSVFDIKGCNALRYMPVGIGKLDWLVELPMFVMRETNFSWEKFLNNMEELKPLKNLRGCLQIKIGFCIKDGNVEKDGTGKIGCLSNKEHLDYVCFSFGGEKGEGKVGNDEAIIEELQPHSNLKRLEMSGYQGIRMPKWAGKDNLANLVRINISFCDNLQSLGCLGILHHLKHLSLVCLWNLKYLVEDYTTGRISNQIASSAVAGLRSSSVEEFSLFPSLEYLYLGGLPKLKGWLRDMDMGDDYQLLQLPQLKVLLIKHCPNLTAIVQCSILANLQLVKFNPRLRIIIKTRKVKGKEKRDDFQMSTLETPSCSSYDPSLKLKVRVDNLKWLNSLHMEALQCLEYIYLEDKEVESLGEGREVFQSCSSTVQSLYIYSCSNLRSVSGGLEHFSSLEKLTINYCHNLRLSEEGEKVDASVIPWKSLKHSLRFLNLSNLLLLVILPYWMQFLISLQSLKIYNCKQLESLPSWMTKLTSLKLRLQQCSLRLNRRCQNSTGEDWPHIQHIPSVIIE